MKLEEETKNQIHDKNRLMELDEGLHRSRNPGYVFRANFLLLRAVEIRD